MKNNTNRYRLVAAVVSGVMIALPTGQALALSQVCTTTLQTFTSAAAPGTTVDAAQPFTFTVPAGVTTVRLDAAGAAGGDTAFAGGLGAEVAGDYAVTPGSVLCVATGVAGGPSGVAGGGGGGTIVYRGTAPCTFAQASIASLLVEAGGGGSAGIAAPEAGLPGLATGLGAGLGGSLAGGNAPGGGTGGTGGNGGAGGVGGNGGGLLTDGALSGCGSGQGVVNGNAGGLPSGGCTGGLGNGGFGGGGVAGGGGGFNGGGGTNGSATGSGGGGSFSAVAPIFAQDGQQAANGIVTICFAAAAVVTPVPTLSQFALALLLGAILLSGLALMRRRR